MLSVGAHPLDAVSFSETGPLNLLQAHLGDDWTGLGLLGDVKAGEPIALSLKNFGPDDADIVLYEGNESLSAWRLKAGETMQEWKFLLHGETTYLDVRSDNRSSLMFYFDTPAPGPKQVPKQLRGVTIWQGEAPEAAFLEADFVTERGYLFAKETDFQEVLYEDLLRGGNAERAIDGITWRQAPAGQDTPISLAPLLLGLLTIALLRRRV